MSVVVSFLGWYFLYIILSAFARDFMARPAIGNINIAMLLGILQFVSTFFLAWRYTRYARRMLDPLSQQLREEAERQRAELDSIEQIMAERRRIETWTPERAGPAARGARHRRSYGETR
ncbi:DUF485 domain-containing protein [Nonomuraea sp. NPDC050328]|uniref:DUF485 domain-containing protein n=1 Tax=Nonomuraea sp. NPDC050328 TaxID=3364361 RepID=UPI0037B6E735